MPKTANTYRFVLVQDLRATSADEAYLGFYRWVRRQLEEGLVGVTVEELEPDRKDLP